MNDYLKSNLEFLIKKFCNWNDVIISFDSEKTKNTSSLLEFLKKLEDFKSKKILNFKIYFGENCFYKNLDEVEDKQHYFELKFNSTPIEWRINVLEKWFSFLVEFDSIKKGENYIEIKNLKKVLIEKSEILNLIFKQIRKLTDTLSSIDNILLNNENFDEMFIKKFSKNNLQKNENKKFLEFEFKIIFNFLIIFWEKNIKHEFENQSFNSKIINARVRYPFWKQLFNYLEMNNENQTNEFLKSINPKVLVLLKEFKKENFIENLFVKSKKNNKSLNPKKNTKTLNPKEEFEKQIKDFIISNPKDKKFKETTEISNKIENKQQKIESHIISFLDFLKKLKNFEGSTNNPEISISFYQRAYVWKDKYIEKLFNNILNCKEDEIHYINQIIIEKKSENKFEVVDGQQRIISLLIIYLVCIKYALCNYDNISITLKKGEYDFEHNKFLENECIKKNFKYKMDENFEECLNHFSVLDFKKLLLKKEKDNLYNSNNSEEKIDDSDNFKKNVLKVINLVFKNIKNEEEFSVFFNKLLNNLCFTLTTFKEENSKNILNIFENLNTNNAVLTSFDLLTCHLFKISEDNNLTKIFKSGDKPKNEKDKKDLESLNEEYKKYRKNIEKIIGKSNSPFEQIQNFTKTVMKGNLNKEISNSFNKNLDMYENLKKLIDNNPFFDEEIKLLSHLKFINGLFEKYINLFVLDIKDWNQYEESKFSIEDFLLLFSKAVKGVYNPLIFKIVEIYINIIKDKKTKFEKEVETLNLRKILFLLETFLIRFSILYSGKSLTSPLDSLLYKLNNDPDHLNQKSLTYVFNIIFDYFENDIEVNSVYNDSLIAENLKKRDFSVSNPVVKKLILNRIDYVIKYASVSIWKPDYLWNTHNTPFSEYEIEHLLAQNEKSGAKEIIENYSKFVNNFGNLLLFKKTKSSLNKTLSNNNIYEKLKLIKDDEENKNFYANSFELLEWNDSNYKKFKELVIKKVKENSQLEKSYLEKAENDKFFIQPFNQKEINELWENDHTKEEKYKYLEKLVKKRSKAISELICLIWNKDLKKWIKILDNNQK